MVIFFIKIFFFLSFHLNFIIKLKLIIIIILYIYNFFFFFFFFFWIIIYFIVNLIFISEYDEDNRVSPEKGNVAFSSAEMRWCFTLETFAQMYSDTYGKYKFYLM